MRVLIAHTGFLGDLVISTPVIGALKYLDHCEVWFLTTPAGHDLVHRDPFLKGIITFDKRGKHRGTKGMLQCAKEIQEKKFDCVFSLHRSARTAFLLWLSKIPRRIGFKESSAPFLYTETKATAYLSHAVLRNLAILYGTSHVIDQELDRSLEGKVTEGKDPDRFGEMRLWGPRAEEVNPDITDRLFTGEGRNTGYVVVAPGSVWATKRWSSQEFHKLAAKLIADGLRVVVVGDKKDIPVGLEVSDSLPVVNLVGKTTLSEILFLVERACGVVCNDSFILHVACALKIPTVTIFCATSPSFGFGPWRNISNVVEKRDLFCKPCSRHGKNHCPTGTELCMRGVYSDQVLEALTPLIHLNTTRHDQQAY